MTTGKLQDMYTAIMFSSTNALGTTTSYWPPGGGGNAWVTGSSTSANSVMPCAGTLSNLYMNLGTAPGVGTSRIFKILKNGSATGIQVTISGANTTGSDTVNFATYVAGDVISLECSVSGVPASTTILNGGVLSQNDPFTGFLLGTTNAAATNSATTYQPIQGTNNTAASAAASVTQYIPTSGSLSNFYVYLNGSPGTGKSYTCTLYKNGVATSAAITISDSATTGSYTSSSVSVSEGDYLYWEVVPSGTPTARKIYLSSKWTPTVNNESIYLFGNDVTMSAVNPSYMFAKGSWNSYSITETNRQGILPGDFRLKKLYVKQSSANGASKDRVYAMRINEASNGPSVTISGASDTSGSNSTTYDASAGNRITMRMTPNSSPTVNYMSMGLVMAYLV
jgi:hypothetical protein